MYAEYFRLNQLPFSLTPDPRFLFASERHREGLAHLCYGVQQPGGFVQLTGEIGSGKTTLCRCLVKQLPPETDVALILNPCLTVAELLATVCDELGIAYPAEKTSPKILIDALNQHLLKSHAQHRRTVLIIDEAQNLHGDVLEQIRLLTNLETSQDKLLQIILIGQPELLSILKRKKLRQLAQRITARYHLIALSRRETYAYVRHRLSVAGRSDPLFTAGAMRHVYRLSGGVPRLINIICDRALLGAYALDRQCVNAAIVCQAGRETLGTAPLYRKLLTPWKAAIVALAVLSVGITIFLVLANPSILRRTLAAAAAAIGKGDQVLAARSAQTRPGVTDTFPKPDVTPRHPEGGNTWGTVPAGVKLLDILADPSLRGNSGTSFKILYARWGIKVPSNLSDLGCQAERVQGFECLYQVGSWSKLRRFDVPAILEMALPTGVRHRVVIVGLEAHTATLAIGNWEYTFPLSEIDKLWTGSFIILWKPPFDRRHLSLGLRSKDVVWVRQTLDALDGIAEGLAVSDLYDESLRQRVIAFQRDRSLIPDGSVGSETLVRLTLALGRPSAPSLSRHTP